MKRIAYISARREGSTAVVRAVNEAARGTDSRVVRFDELAGLPDSGNDLAQFLKSADLVVAHLRHLNPNILYEVGLAHGLGKAVVLIAPASLNLPIDLRGQRIISYEEKPDVAKLTFALKEWLHELGRKSSLEQSPSVRRPYMEPQRVFVSYSAEAFESEVGRALSSVPGWEVQASSIEDRDGAFDFIIWRQDIDSTLAAIGNPIGVEVKARPPQMDAIRSLVETTKKQGLKALLLIIGSRLPQKLRRSIGSIGGRSGIIVLALDAHDIESLDSPGDFTRLLRQSLIDLRLA